jgi:hypothetical protein
MTKTTNLIRDLYTEKNGILDDDGDTEVDLASYAYQIWKNATDADPPLVGAKSKQCPTWCSPPRHTPKLRMSRPRAFAGVYAHRAG